MTSTSAAPDVILHNGRVITVDDAFSVAQAVSIRDGRFAAVGSDGEIVGQAGPRTRTIDLEGKTVVPGLIDSHLHLHMAAMNAPAVQLIDCRSIADVQAAVAERAAVTPAGEWIVGSSGWHESLLAENRLPTRDELDAAAPDNPVFVPRGGHVGSGNSLALKLAGINEGRADPAGGVIVREAGGTRPTGVLLETASKLVRAVLPPPPPAEEQQALLRQAMRTLNGYGITGTLEPGLDEARIALFEALRERGEATVRTDLMYWANNIDDARRGIAFSGFANDDMLRFVGVKFMLDGGVEGARLYEPYQMVAGEQNDPDYRGLFLLPPGGEEEFVEALKLIAAAGLQVQCHGVGDEAIDLIVRSYLAADRETPIRDLRWVVMHMHLPTRDAIAKMADAGILATVQDHSVLLGANKVKWWGRERASYSTPNRLLIDSGLLIGGGTDAPILPIDPFVSMWWMVTRQTLQGDTLGPDQAISAKEALQLYTINNARILGSDRDRGSIEPGKLADLAVLSQDPLTVAPDRIRDTRALLTMLGGRIVHEAG